MSSSSSESEGKSGDDKTGSVSLLTLPYDNFFIALLLLQPIFIIYGTMD
jgi:hypothetical protein